MARIPGLRVIFRLPASRRRVEREVSDELEFHIEMEMRELVARGLEPERARAEALRRFGDVREAREELSAIDRGRVRRERRAEWWEAVVHDLRYAVRGLRAKPGFAAVVVLTLGLGIGANATMFGIVDRLLLRPPAYLRDPGATGRVYLTLAGGRGFDHPGAGVERTSDRTSYATYKDLRDGTRSFAQLAATFLSEVVVGEGASTREADAMYVSANFWSLFDARPVLGRFFGPDEDREPASEPVAVLGYDFWRSAFGGDTAAVGRPLRIGSVLYTVIGVAPRGFTGQELTNVDIWVPITAAASTVVGPDYATTYNTSWLQIVGRRRSGVTAEQTNADLTEAYRRSTLKSPNARPLAEARPRAQLASVLQDRGPNSGESAKVATWLGGVSLLVLLIACANVANLLLARALRRQREIAVRVALGVSRARLLGQLLVESVLLAALGAIAGLVVAHWGGGVLRAVLLPEVAWSSSMLDLRTLGFVAVAALLAGILSGLAPALHASRPDLTLALKAGAREGAFQRSRTRTALLVIQAALSVVLLVGAGLFVRSLRNVRGIDLGFDAARVAYVHVDMRGEGAAFSDTSRAYQREQVALYARLGERLGSLPGIDHVGTTTALPFHTSYVRSLVVPGVDSVEALGPFYLAEVGGDYFGAMSTSILRGRALDDRDRAGAPLTAVVSASMARVLWPGRDALGQCIKVGQTTSPCSTVVGVAEDLHRGSVRDDPGLQYYVAGAQAGRDYAPNGIVAAVHGDPAAMAGAIRRALQPLVPGAAYVQVRPLREIVDPQFRSWRLGATMFSAFGALALLISAVGLYGVIAYTVAQRTHELGVRIALGAQTGDVLRLVVLEGVRVAVAGVAVGLAVALGAGRFVAPLLFGVQPNDPGTLSGVAGVLLLVAAAASLVPAWRAAHVDPAAALRAE
jgi:predicted permease